MSCTCSSCKKPNSTSGRLAELLQVQFLSKLTRTTPLPQKFVVTVAVHLLHCQSKPQLKSKLAQKVLGIAETVWDTRVGLPLSKWKDTDGAKFRSALAKILFRFQKMLAAVSTRPGTYARIDFRDHQYWEPDCLIVARFDTRVYVF